MIVGLGLPDFQIVRQCERCRRNPHVGLSKSLPHTRWDYFKSVSLTAQETQPAPTT